MRWYFPRLFLAARFRHGSQIRDRALCAALAHVVRRLAISHGLEMFSHGTGPSFRPSGSGQSEHLLSAKFFSWYRMDETMRAAFRSWTTLDARFAVVPAE